MQFFDWPTRDDNCSLLYAAHSYWTERLLEKRSWPECLPAAERKCCRALYEQRYIIYTSIARVHLFSTYFSTKPNQSQFSAKVSPLIFLKTCFLRHLAPHFTQNSLDTCSAKKLCHFNFINFRRFIRLGGRELNFLFYLRFLHLVKILWTDFRRIHFSGTKANIY